jgi:TPR repeat protein
MHGRHATRLLELLLASVLGLTATGAAAGPEDDFREGQVAFRRGDVNTAVKTLRRAGDAGHAPSLVLLGYIYEQGSLDADAVAAYRKAAALGSGDGEVALAGMVAAGKGTAANPKEAIRLYENAAQQGNATAINVLAQAYISAALGLTPGQRDDAKAVAALRRAAEGGYAPAAAALARAYEKGDYGLAPDAAAAARWAPKAAPGPAPKAAAR